MIYDEAKQELVEIETYLEHSLDHISKALERAKKVEELLGLYREYRKGVIFYIKNSISNIMIINAIKIDDLEKELEKMK